MTFAAWTHTDVALALSLPPWVLFWFLWAWVRCLAADRRRNRVLKELVNCGDGAAS